MMVAVLREREREVERDLWIIERGRAGEECIYTSSLITTTMIITTMIFTTISTIITWIIERGMDGWRRMYCSSSPLCSSLAWSAPPWSALPWSTSPWSSPPWLSPAWSTTPWSSPPWSSASFKCWLNYKSSSFVPRAFQLNRPGTSLTVEVKKAHGNMRGIFLFLRSKHYRWVWRKRSWSAWGRRRGRGWRGWSRPPSPSSRSRAGEDQAHAGVLVFLHLDLRWIGGIYAYRHYSCVRVSKK